MPATADGPQRSDAQRNRERIIEVALTELARDADVPLSVIAKKAGVGQATFYRNFPDREALLWAAYHREAQRLVDSAHELLDRSDPKVALREWMTELAKFARAKSGLAIAMGRSILPTDESARPGHALVVDAIGLLLEANREAGTIRADVTVEDFTFAVAGVFLIAPDQNWEAQVGRLLDLVMDGLQARAPGAGAAGKRARRPG